jgi:hypothetical protein
MYNVGFGDCFLMSFAYAQPVESGLDAGNPRLERHILFDFGTTRRARSKVTPQRLATAIANDCGGRLDAVVITHRHADHLSGFGGKTTAPILKALAPLLVVRSWTENPRLAANSGRPRDGASLADSAAGEPTHDGSYLGRLLAGQQLADRVVSRAREAGKTSRANLVAGALQEVSNPEAIDTLNELSREGRGEYLFADQPTRLNQIAPGVTFRVLGPPKPSQWPDVARQASESDEFWLAGGERQVSRLFGGGSGGRSKAEAVPLGTAQWIMERLRNDDERQVAALVRWLDDALNNTSVVLLITVGSHRLLFGGDAQIENWGWTLAQIENDTNLADELRAVDLYKVGHHGSRNATPKSLYELWHKREGKPPFLSMMSTKAGVHGLDDHAVPRKTLVDALALLGPVISTDDGEADWIEARADVPDGKFQVILPT